VSPMPLLSQASRRLCRGSTGLHGSIGGPRDRFVRKHNALRSRGEIGASPLSGVAPTGIALALGLSIASWMNLGDEDHDHR